MVKSLPVVQKEKGAPPRAAIDFDEKLAAHGLELRAAGVETLQVNVGKLCNQACKHCHVDAGPARTEMMTREVAEQVVAALRRFRVPALDITGGAPELNPSFRYLVAEARSLGAHVLVRHNLTVMFEPGRTTCRNSSARTAWRRSRACRTSSPSRRTRSAGAASSRSQSKRCAA